MPQIAQLALVYQSQWFWLALTLAVIFFFVGRGIVPRVEATVDQRDAKIAADLAEAERLQHEADAAEETWRGKINDARANAHSVVTEAKAKAVVDAEKRVAAADKRLAKKAEEAAAALDEARKSALTEIEGVAVEATSALIAKLTGASINEEAARKAVAGALNNA